MSKFDSAVYIRSRLLNAIRTRLPWWDENDVAALAQGIEAGILLTFHEPALATEYVSYLGEDPQARYKELLDDAINGAATGASNSE